MYKGFPTYTIFATLRIIGRICISWVIWSTTTNFALADISVSGGSMASFSGSGSTYTANFTPSSNGATTIDVAGSTFTDNP